MNDAVADVETRLARAEAGISALEDGISALDARLRALEGGGLAASAVNAPAEGATDASSPAATGRTELGTLLPLVGRTFIAFGGAFLLRALTDAGRLAAPAGIAIGLGFALTCLLLAGRAAARGRAWSGTLHGFTGLAIGLPLLWEASTRFGFLSAPWSAAALGVLAGVGLGTAWRARLHGLASLTTVGVLATAVALVGGTGHFIPFTFILVGLGVATLWLGYDRDWFWMRWPAALAANVAVIALTTRATHPNHLDAAAPVILVQLLLLGSYLTSFGVRTLWRRRTVIVFEVVQTVAALVVGLGGAVAVARATGTGEPVLGAVTALLGIAGYAAAFAVVSRREGAGPNFYFYSTLGLLLGITAVTVLLRGASQGLTLAGLAVATTWLGRTWSRQTLVAHGAVYGLAAAAASGLLAGAVSALAGAPPAAAATSLAGWATLAAMCTCLVIPRAESPGAAAWFSTATHATFAIVALAGTAATLVRWLTPTLAGSPPDPGTLATVRTAVLAFAATGFAACSRHRRLADLAWLPYTVLAVGALKLLAEDFPTSKPSTLFVALVLFGAALLATPRLVRHASADVGRASGPGTPGASAPTGAG